MNRFFNGTFPSLLELLDQHVARARKQFDCKPALPIDALILGGGYGRGEGGVYLAAQEPRLFNDLDYFLFTPEPENPKLLDAVRTFERVESEALGIDVEVTCLRPNNLVGAEKSMMFHDLVMGHLVLVGPDEYLASWKAQMDPVAIEAIEATRLLWNRGSGLFFARSRLEEPAARDFIYRQHMKLALALGDALLCLSGEHSAFCETRKQRFANFESPLVTNEIRALHASGVDFKQRPHEPPADLDLAAQNARLRELWSQVFLHVEQTRLGISFASLADYAKTSQRLFPAEAVWRCLALALRDRLKRGGLLKPITDYPRGALMRALALLNQDSPDLEQVRKILPIQGVEPAKLSKVYEVWWAYYS